MPGAISILILIVCVGGCLFCFFLKKSKNPSHKSSSLRHSRAIPKEIPPWLETCLRDYEKQALVYSLYRTSLRSDLSPAALAVQKNLEIKVYIRPALLLSEAKGKAGCSDVEMEEYLRLYYAKKTGKTMVINIDAVYTVQEMLLQMVQNEVESLQTRKQFLEKNRHG